MIEPRVYRAAFVPAIVALLIAMFSLESQPPPAPLDLAADVLFQGDSAAAGAERIARQNPDRRPGEPGNGAVAELMAARFEASGFDVDVDEFMDDGHDLVNVVGTRPGSGRDRIVVLAARDADSVPDLAGSAADSAALLELAVALEGRASEKTIVLGSVDGSTLGDAGIRRFAETTPDSEHIDAALLLSDVGSGAGAGARLVAWSNDASRGSIGLERTATEALRGEFETVPTDEGVATQFAQLAMPIGIGGQGVLLEEGIDAIRFSGSGTFPADTESRRIDRERLGGVGRAVLRTVSAVDASDGLEHGPGSYLVAGRNVLPGWAVALLALSLILPALVASVDAFARARRRREPVGSWSSWLVARIVPFALGLLVALLVVLTGLAPNVSAAAPNPSLEPLDVGGAALLGLVGATVALAWLFLRPALARLGDAPADPGAPGAGCAVALVLACTTLVVWVINPWASVALLPAAHLWALALLADRSLRPRGRALLVAGGLALPVAVALVYMVRLSLDPLEALWYFFLLVAGGQVDLLSALVGCVIAGTLASTVEILVARRHRPEPAEAPRPAVRGPGGYAGPGSLGGTESALKR